MAVTVYTRPGCNNSLKACYKLRQMGVDFHETQMPMGEMGLVKALWRAGSFLPVVKIGENEYHDYLSALHRLEALGKMRKTAADEDFVPPPRVL